MAQADPERPGSPRPQKNHKPSACKVGGLFVCGYVGAIPVQRGERDPPPQKKMVKIAMYVLNTNQRDALQPDFIGMVFLSWCGLQDCVPLSRRRVPLFSKRYCYSAKSPSTAHAYWSTMPCRPAIGTPLEKFCDLFPW